MVRMLWDETEDLAIAFSTTGEKSGLVNRTERRVKTGEFILGESLEDGTKSVIDNWW